jgi:2,5-diketo-D-gluconate reductase B
MNTNHLNVQNVLVNGVAVPSIGFGTYGMGGANGMGAERLVRLISRAISAGFRHIGTAQIYGNEVEVGAAIQQSGIRERLGDLASI